MKSMMQDGMRALSSALQRFSDDESGATAIEYGLIVSLIFVAILGAINQYADNTSTMYSKISSAMSS
ncbi:MAG: Flp family type IVb pilin [Pseudomonadota bacterium]